MDYDTYLIASDFVHQPNGPAPLFHDKFERGRIEYTGNWIPLRSGRCFFFVLAYGISETEFREQLGGTGEILGRSYADLHASDNPVKFEIFTAEGGRTDLNGVVQHIQQPVCSFVPGDAFKSNTVRQPTSFGGTIPEFTLPVEMAAKLSIAQRQVEQSTKGPLAIYPVFGLGITGLPEGVLTIADTSWRPSALYGPNHELFRTWQGGLDGPPLFTGAFEFAMPPAIAAVHGMPRVQWIDQTKATVFRLLTAIWMLSDVCPYAFSETIIENGSTSFTPLPRPGSMQWMVAHRHNVATIDEVIARKAIEVASSTRTGGLSRGIRSCLDALAHARVSWDRRLSYILLWAAIEAIATNSNREGLTTNIALALLGAAGPSPDSARNFKDLKRAYGTRSNLVHNFSAPADHELEVDARISFRFLRALFLKAIAEVSAGREDAQKFTGSLIERALATA